jgi:ABC-type nitrate/sulfonate/bicarbonate transport system permease component
MYQLIILALFLLASIAWKIKPAREGIPALVAAGIYLLGMTIIYLLTPQDLAWHLWTTIDRTMLTVNGGIIVGWYFLLTKMEVHPLWDEGLKTADRG